MLTDEQDAAVERYVIWLALWQTNIASDLATLGLPANLILAVHSALAELTSTATIFTATAAGLAAPVVAAITA